MLNELSLLGIEPQALKHEDLGEEDAKYLGHDVGLDKLLVDMMKQGKEIHDRLKLTSMIIETSLRNIYGCPMAVCYWSPPKSKVVHIRMTNTSLQMVSTITIDFSEQTVVLDRTIANFKYSASGVKKLDDLKKLVADGIEWAAVPPNPQTPLFFNKDAHVCVLVDYSSLKVFTQKETNSYSEEGLIPAWAKHVSDTWKVKHATAIYASYKEFGDIVFTKLNATPPKVHGVIVIEQQ